LNLLTVLILLFLGLLLLAAEIILPGGVAGAIGAMLFITGTIGAFSISISFGLWVVFAGLVLGGATVMLLIHCMQHTRLGKHTVLQQNAGDWHGYEEENKHLEGESGVAHGPLHPGGTAIIDDQRFHVVTQGEMIEAGSPVRVVQVQGNRIIVEQIEENFKGE